MSDYGDESRWLVKKYGNCWMAIRPMEHDFAKFFASWREAMDFVIQEAGL
jgi:hypothetical protein